LLIVKPYFSISTTAAYAKVHFRQLTQGQKNNRIKTQLVRQRPVTEWAGLIYNRFEEILLPEYPDIARIKKGLMDCGALNVLLSGSGSAVFGIFTDEKNTRRAGKEMFKKFPGINCFPTETV
jgi:4-diphosphocytidyl-2-C-methyl-D-erythritol kinase